MKILYKLITIGGIVLGSLLPLKKSEAQVSGSFSSAIKTHYVAYGYVLGKGPHKQDVLSLSHKNLNAFFWSDYDFGKKETLEVDAGLNYSKEINKNLSTSIGYTLMHYPKGEDDNVLNLDFNHRGKLNKNLGLSYFIKNKEIPNGLTINADVSKSINLGKNNNLSVGVSSTYLKNFYNDSGFSHISPTISLSHNKDNTSLRAYLTKQYGFIDNPKMLPPAKDQLHGGIELGVNF